MLWRLPERNDVGLSCLYKTVTRYFDARLDTRKDSCFGAECFRRLKAK
jgi:hypothetical protein